MPYEIIACEKEKSVVAIHTRKMDAKQCLEAAKKVGNILYKNKWHRLLIDARGLFPSFPITEGCVVTANNVNQFPRSTRLALLSVDLNKEDTHFIKTLFLNHGIELGVQILFIPVKKFVL